MSDPIRFRGLAQVSESEFLVDLERGGEHRNFQINLTEIGPGLVSVCGDEQFEKFVHDPGARADIYKIISQVCAWPQQD